jgi:hypothetical protein
MLSTTDNATAQPTGKALIDKAPGVDAPAVEIQADKAPVKKAPKEMAPADKATAKPAPKSKTPPKVYQAYLDPAQVSDPLFDFMGEYVGTVYAGHGMESAGLQVAVHAERQLMGTLYMGGLPGEGWDGTQTEHVAGEFSGAADDQSATFNFSSGTITITGLQGKFKSRSGVVGQFQKIRRESPTLGMSPPTNAEVLFRNGKAHGLVNPQLSSDNYLERGTETEKGYQDFRLHVEFRLPYMPDANDQARGNSGIYLQNRYEMQVLDSFGEDVRFNSCASIYRQKETELSMCLPPLAWQTYDIWFTAATFDNDGKKIEPARVTLFQNGVPVHYNQVIEDKTGAGKPEGPDALPTKFQDHKDPVRFRNIWLVSGPQSLPARRVLYSSTATTPVNTPCTNCQGNDYGWDNGGYGTRPGMYPYYDYNLNRHHGTYGKLWPY